MARPFSSIPEALAAVARGRLIVVCDDGERDAQGHLMAAAELISPDHVNFMATHARGLVCVGVTEEAVDRLGLPTMPGRNLARHGTAFTVSVEAASGVSTGISAADRATTIRVAADPRSGAGDLVCPGHVFPLRTHPAGVLRRAGHAEAAVDVARLAGLEPAGVVCGVLSDDGTMAGVGELLRFGERHGLPVISIAQLVEHRRRSERIVRRAAQARLPTRHGTFRALAYTSDHDEGVHLALVMGEPEGADDVPVRVHAPCLTGEALHSLRCDCSEHLDSAMRVIAAQGEGVLVVVERARDEMALLAQIRAYELEDRGLAGGEAGARRGCGAGPREHGLGAQILEDLGVTRSVDIAERVPVRSRPDDETVRYLRRRADGRDRSLEGVWPAATDTMASRARKRTG